jgi:hypothetical protein
MTIILRDITGYNFEDVDGHDLNDNNISIEDFRPFDREYAEVWVNTGAKTIEELKSYIQSKKNGKQNDRPIVYCGWVKPEKNPDGGYLGIVYLIPAE